MEKRDLISYNIKEKKREVQKTSAKPIATCIYLLICCSKKAIHFDDDDDDDDVNVLWYPFLLAYSADQTNHIFFLMETTDAGQR